MFLAWQNCPQEGGSVPWKVAIIMKHKPVLQSPPPCPWGLLGCVPTVSPQQWGLFEGTGRGMLWMCQVVSGTPGDTEAGAPHRQTPSGHSWEPPALAQLGMGTLLFRGPAGRGTAQVTLSPRGPCRARLHRSPGGLRPWHQCSPSVAPAQAACGDIRAGVTGSG